MKKETNITGEQVNIANDEATININNYYSKPDNNGSSQNSEGFAFIIIFVMLVVMGGYVKYREIINFLTLMVLLAMELLAIIVYFTTKKSGAKYKLPLIIANGISCLAVGAVYLGYYPTRGKIQQYCEAVNVDGVVKAVGNEGFVFAFGQILGIGLMGFSVLFFFLRCELYFLSVEKGWEKLKKLALGKTKIAKQVAAHIFFLIFGLAFYLGLIPFIMGGIFNQK